MQYFKILFDIIMWKAFEFCENLYMLKVIENDESLEIYLNDLKEIWIQNIKKESVLEQFQQKNPVFDVKLEGAVTQVVELVNRVSQEILIKITKHEDTLELALESNCSDFTVKFNFILKREPPDVFSKEITVPLVRTVHALEKQRDMLCKLIQKKDRELEEYKMEKGEISRTDLVTEKFDNSLLNNLDDKSMLNVFTNCEAFWLAFKQRHGEVEIAVEDVKVEPWNHSKRKRKVYSSKTIVKKGKGMNYK